MPRLSITSSAQWSVLESWPPVTQSALTPHTPHSHPTRTPSLIAHSCLHSHPLSQFGPTGPKSRWFRLMYSLCISDTIPTLREWEDYNNLICMLAPKREMVANEFINQMPKKGTEVKRVWNSVEEVAKHFGVPQFQVRNVAEGRKKSTLGFRWVKVC